MGLVVQAPGNALLALLAGPSAEGAPVAVPGEAGVFAEFMATLLPDGSAGGTEGTEGEGLGLPFPAPTEQENKTSNESALALLTAATLVQFVPQSKPPTAPVAEPPSVATGSAEAGTAASLQAPSLPGVPVEGEAPAEGASPVGDAAVSRVEQPATGPEAATAGIPDPASQPDVSTEPAVQPRPADGPSPTEPASEAQPESGVVRPVGNAETSNRSQGGQDNGKSGERGQATAPGRVQDTPRASASGIENAAPNSAVGELRAPGQGTPPAETPAVEAPAPVEVPPQLDQVAATVFESVEVGATEARLRLDPAEMGEVVIRIHADADGLRIDIRAERPEAMQLFRDRTEQLSQLLGDRGLNLSDVNVGLGRGDNDQSGDGNPRRNATPADGEFAAILGIDESGSAARHNRLRSAYNPDGSHIYRV